MQMSAAVEVRLIGPGGAGKSTLGPLLAECLKVTFIDLDRSFSDRLGDISDYIGRHGYNAYARQNVEIYCSTLRGASPLCVVALSSGVMTYAPDTHPEYSRIRRELEHHPGTFILLPSFDCDDCVAETVRPANRSSFGRTLSQEEAVIRARFEIYMAMPMRKIETMRPISSAMSEIVAALAQ